MLDPDDRDSLCAELLDRRDQLEHLGLGQPAPDLVEQEHPGPRRERPGELESLALEQRQLSRKRVRLVEELDAPERLDARLLHVAVRLAATVDGADEHVLERRQPREGARDLKRPGDTDAAVLVAGEPRDVAALEEDAPAIGAEAAGDDVQQCRLAGPVGSHDAERFALGDRRD